MKNLKVLLIVLVCMGFTLKAEYPIDGYSLTGIKRLAYLERVKSGEISSDRIPEGAFRPLDSIKLNLNDKRGKAIKGIPETDSDLQKKIDHLFNGLDKNYSIAVLDMTKGKPVRYADHRETAQYQPGSVGKLVVLAAFFTELCDLYPNDFEERRALLKRKIITAGKWALHDHHTIPVYDLETKKLVKRTVRDTDTFSLYEWLDHMVSVSNNGAASVVWREALLMRVFKDKYPDLTFEESEEYFKSMSKSELSEMAIEMVNEPLRELGISEDEWRLGKFFTSGAGSYIPGRGGSIGTTNGLIKYILALEKGELIDEPTSLEMKRLLYMTDRRIRYAASKKLDSAAVYFKSGSLYKCDRDKNPDCGKYQGNVYNYMNSVAIVEQPDGSRYAVCLMSNVHNKNSAYDHLSLASRIDAIMRE